MIAFSGISSIATIIPSRGIAYFVYSADIFLVHCTLYLANKYIILCFVGFKERLATLDFMCYPETKLIADAVENIFCMQ